MGRQKLQNSITYICKFCEIEFPVPKSHAKSYNREHCSQKCRDSTNNTAKICLYCGDEYTRKNSTAKNQKYCSPTCSGHARKGWNHTEDTKLLISKRNKDRIKNGYIPKGRKKVPGIYQELRITESGKTRRVFEHVLKAEKILGRRLRKGEIVHHVNGERSDNRNRNLLICTQSYHAWIHHRMAHLYQVRFLSRLQID